MQVLPAHGLTLEEVGYPPDEELAARAEPAAGAPGAGAVSEHYFTRDPASPARLARSPPGPGATS